MNSAAFRAILVLSATDNMSRTVNAAIGNAQTRMARFGARAQNVGMDMMRGGGMIAAPFVLGAKAAIDFEDAFTGVTKTWRGTETQLDATRKGIMAMSKSAQNTATANELSRIAEQAGQLGIEADNVLRFTRTIADLGATTNLGDEAAPSFAKFANITKMPQANFDRLGSTVVALGNNMATTEADILSFGMRIAGAGAQVDIPQAKIMGLAAGLSSVGIEAEAGGTAISKTLIELANRTKSGGAALEEVASIAGRTGAQFKTDFAEDAAGATVKFIEGLGKIKESGGNVFQTLDKLGMGEVRLRDTLLRASGAGDLMRKSLDISSTAWDENTALTKEAETRYKTTASQMKIFKNNVTALAITVGNAIMPALTSMVGVLQRVTNWIGDAAENYPRLTKAVSMGAAALGAFLVVGGGVAYAIGTISRITSAATSVLNAFGGVTKLVTAAQWLWNAAMVANPIGLIVVAVVAAIGAVAAMVVYWDELTAAVSNAHPALIAIGAVILAPVLPLVAIAGAIRWVIDNWDDLPGAAERAVISVGKFLLGLVPKAAHVFGQIVGFVVALPVKIPMWIGRAVYEGAAALWAGRGAVISGAKGAFWSIVEVVATLPERLFQAGINIVTSLWEGMKSVAYMPLEFMSGLAEGMMSYLPFSPAKQGPFKRIMDVQIVQSIAKGMTPQPMVQAMQQATGQTMGVINSPGKAAPSVNPARSSGGGSVVVNFAPVVNISGAANVDEIEATTNELWRRLQAKIRDEARSFMG